MRKKRIVAMALAMSIFASTFGMLGAAAADAEPIEDTTGGSITVTVVPLESAGDTEGEEPKTTETGDEAKDTDTEPGTPEDGDTTDADKEPDYSQIERPGQSDTVETLPGDAKDNEDHIKGEDKADSKDDTSEPETPAEGEDKTDTETPAEGDDKDATETPAEGDKDAETDPEKPAEDDVDYSVVVDEKTGHFKITFNIKEDASGDQTIELSKVQEVVNAYGKQLMDEYLKTPEADKDPENYLWAPGGTYTHTFPELGLTYIRYRDGSTYLVEEPSCTTVFDISLSNGSKHTYVYKNNSFTVATPDWTGKGNSGVEGFDGQEITDKHADDDINLSYDTDDSVVTPIDALIDKALEAQKETYDLCVNKKGEIVKDYQRRYSSDYVTVPSGTSVVPVGSYYYVVTADGYYYGKISASYVDKKTNTLKKDCTKAKPQVFTKAEDDSLVAETYEKVLTRGNDNLLLRASSGEIKTALKKYVSKANSTIDDELLKIYNEQLGTEYTDLMDLISAEPTVAEELHNGDVALNYYINYRSSDKYDNFYKNLLSFNVGSQKEMDKFLEDASTGSGNSKGHGKWASDGYNMTIGDYMADKLDENPGAWDKANAYFDQLLQTGMSPNEATWAAFTMAVNLDGNTNNTYEDSAWQWYASMILEQADGKFELTKTDKDTGETITSDETSFYLWTYGKDEDGNDATLYYTNIPDEVDEEGNVTKPGFTGWAKYDPTKKNLTYTITTTDGKLNIDYDLLKNVVYYLQEAAAPKGYDIDTTVYVICDSEEEFNKIKESGELIVNEAAGTTSSASDLSYIGAITPGGDTLTFKFVNSKTVAPPDPTPDPDPKPTPDPENPDNPVDPENPDNPPVQDETPDEETPVTPENPSNPPVQDAAAELPKTGTTGWMVSLLMTAGLTLLAGGWFASRRQHAPKH